MRLRSRQIRRIKNSRVLITTRLWVKMKTDLIIMRFKPTEQERKEWWQRKNSKWREISTTRFLKTLLIKKVASQTRMLSTTEENSQLTPKSAQSTTVPTRTFTWNNTKPSWSNSSKGRNKSATPAGRTTTTLLRSPTTILRTTYLLAGPNTRSSKSPRTHSRWQMRTTRVPTTTKSRRGPRVTISRGRMMSWISLCRTLLRITRLSLNTSRVKTWSIRIKAIIERLELQALVPLALSQESRFLEAQRMALALRATTQSTLQGCSEDTTPLSTKGKVRLTNSCRVLKNKSPTLWARTKAKINIIRNK